MIEGFDPRFDCVEDFVRKITHAIWEERDVGQISDWYGDAVRIATPHRESVHIDAAVRSMVEALHTFGDRAMLAEDVLAAPCGGGRFHVSHRIFSTMLHSGEGVYGVPSQRPLGVRMIADRVCAANTVLREWHVVDQLAIARQIGVSRDELAARFALARRARGDAEAGADGLIARWAGDDTDAAPAGLARTIVDRYCEMWAGDNAGIVPDLYDRAATLHAPGGEMLIGAAGVDRFLSGYRAAFPNGEMQVHQVVVREDPRAPVRIALRWSLRAPHDGYGRFGLPTGRDVALLGISHLELRGALVLREYLMLDDVAIAGQLLPAGTEDMPR
jgi:predicted ester cyclase